MTEVVGQPCCVGAPLDAAGRPREVINDCPFDPRHLVFGLMPHPDTGAPLTLLVATCDLHRAAVLDFLEHLGLDPETAAITKIEALPALKALAGDDVWTLSYQAA